MLRPGTEAPPFKGETQSGETISLEDFGGQRVALYFYPKDDTPGCTKEACSLRDGYERLQAEDIQIIGVSTDSVTSHDAFADKYELPFPLIADEDHAIIEKYEVHGKFGNAKRITYIIDEDGMIEEVIRDVNVENHANQILETV